MTSWSHLSWYWFSAPCLQNYLLQSVLIFLLFESDQSRLAVALRITNRFAAFEISANQFVGSIAKVTFLNQADQESVIPCESITIDHIVCPVRGHGSPSSGVCLQLTF